jgi:putative acyl-CoA dehydrogenase
VNVKISGKGKRAPNHAYEAMECLGGVGYVEENIMPRLYREAPVNAIWEGSGNVQCLDVPFCA